MPLFLIERSFAQEVMVDDAIAAHVKEVNDEIGIQWLYSFLSEDKRKTMLSFRSASCGQSSSECGKRYRLMGKAVPRSDLMQRPCMV